MAEQTARRRAGLQLVAVDLEGGVSVFEIRAGDCAVSQFGDDAVVGLVAVDHHLDRPSLSVGPVHGSVYGLLDPPGDFSYRDVARDRDGHGEVSVLVGHGSSLRIVQCY